METDIKKPSVFKRQKFWIVMGILTVMLYLAFFLMVLPNPPIRCITITNQGTYCNTAVNPAIHQCNVTSGKPVCSSQTYTDNQIREMENESYIKTPNSTTANGSYINIP